MWKNRQSPCPGQIKVKGLIGLSGVPRISLLQRPQSQVKNRNPRKSAGDVRGNLPIGQSPGPSPSQVEILQIARRNGKDGHRKRHDRLRQQKSRRKRPSKKKRRQRQGKDDKEEEATQCP